MEYVLIPRDLYERLKVLLENPPMVLQMSAMPKSPTVFKALASPESHEVFPERADDVHGSTQVVNKREQAIRAAERSASEIVAQALKDAEERERAAGLHKEKQG